MDSKKESVNSILPKHFALKSKLNDFYLRYIHEDNKLHGFLQYTGGQVVSPFTKFEVESSKTGKGLVYIRCCYNNKYWALQSESSHYIVASANKAEEDQSKYPCTLFKPIYDRDLESFRFRHVGLNLNLNLHSQDDPRPPHINCLFAKESEPGSEPDLTTVVNWDMIVVLPKHVAFKGNNGKYLKVHNYYNNRKNVTKTYLQFSGREVGDSEVANEVFMTADGHIRLKNVSSGKFWVRDPNWTTVNATDEENPMYDPNTLFWPIKLGNKTVALRNMGNDNFCGSLSQGTLLSDTKIYDQKPLVIASGIVENKNTVPDKVSMKLSYEDATTTTWNSSISAKLGVKMTISTGVPKIAEGEIEISAEISEEYSWGEKQESKTLVEVLYDVVVPPSYKVKTSIVATQGTCDVPFSYIQADRLLNGSIVTQRLDDGVYTAVNCYDYQFVTEEIPL